MMSKWFWILFALVGVVVLFRKPIEALYAARVTGLTAASDAATLNGYTTYNTQIYTPPSSPLLRFFKAGSFLKTSASTGQGDEMNYSVQG